MAWGNLAEASCWLGCASYEEPKVWYCRRFQASEMAWSDLLEASCWLIFWSLTLPGHPLTALFCDFLWFLANAMDSGSRNGEFWKPIFDEIWRLVRKQIGVSMKFCKKMNFFEKMRNFRKIISELGVSKIHRKNAFSWKKWKGLIENNSVFNDCNKGADFTKNLISSISQGWQIKGVLHPLPLN